MPRAAKSLFQPYKIEEVKTQRTCGHFRTTIHKGEPCLIFSDGYRDSSPYSPKAVRKMIRQARAELAQLESTFGDADSDEE